MLGASGSYPRAVDYYYTRYNLRLLHFKTSHGNPWLPSNYATSPKPSAISMSPFVHERILRVASLPEIVILDEGADGFLGEHGADMLEVLAMILEGLLEDDFILHRPLL